MLGDGMGSVKSRIESTVELALLLAYHSRPTKRGYRSPVNNLEDCRGFLVSGQRPRLQKFQKTGSALIFSKRTSKEAACRKVAKAYRKL